MANSRRFIWQGSHGRVWAMLFNSYDLLEIGRKNVFKQLLIDFLSLTKCRP